jgi:hypothetical protein
VNSVARASLDVAGLVVEVLDADLAHAAQPQAVADDLVGPLVVDVDLQRPGVAGDEDALPDRLEVVPDRVDVEGLPGMSLDEEHRLVAEALVDPGGERRTRRGR